MELRDILARRRMVRTFRPDPVPREVLERIAAVVRRVPSAGFSQGQRLVVVTEEETRLALAAAAGEAEYGTPFLSAAPVHAVVGVSERAYRARYAEPDKLDEQGQEIEWPVPYWFVDAGALMMLVLLAAIDEGLASAFVGVPDPAAARAAVALPDDVQPVGIALLGYPAPEDHVATSRSAARRLPLDELVRWESWNRS